MLRARAWRPVAHAALQRASFLSLRASSGAVGQPASELRPERRRAVSQRAKSQSPLPAAKSGEAARRTPLGYVSPRARLAAKLSRWIADVSHAAGATSGSGSVAGHGHSGGGGGFGADGASWRTVLRALGGNAAISVLKFWAWAATNSSAMLAEALHTTIDTANQALLLYGLQQASRAPDASHPYGYGRNAFFYSLLSAMGLFWAGAGVTITHGIYSILHPHEAFSATWHTWAVLGFSFVVDSWVLQGALRELHKQKPKDRSLYAHIKQIKDPMMMAVILEDVAATSGAVIAAGSIALAQMTGDPLFDALGSVTVGCLLGGVAWKLVRMNQRLLIGFPAEPEIENGIRELIAARPSVDAVAGVQTEWLGPQSFAFRATVDFDGRYFAEQLAPAYDALLFPKPSPAAGGAGGESGSSRSSAAESPELSSTAAAAHQQEMLKEDLMACYAEDVTRLAEKELSDIRAAIRAKFPQCGVIELQPSSIWMQHSKLEHTRGQLRKKAARRILDKSAQSAKSAAVSSSSTATTGQMPLIHPQAPPSSPA